MRIGNGYDVHALAKGEELILGGVKINHTKGTIAHSDGDVLIHAICDAILGAAALGDIGLHFPDTSDKFKNINSGILLQKVLQLIKNKGYHISNIDSTICLQSPKINKYIPTMRNSLSLIMGIDVNNISIKATTTERLGFIGREEGIAVYAVVLLNSNN